MFKIFSVANYPPEKFDLEDQLNKFVSQRTVVITNISQSSGKVGNAYVTTVTLAYHPRSHMEQGSKPGGSKARVIFGTRSCVEEALRRLEKPEVCHMAQSEYYQEQESYMVVTIID